MRKLLSFYRKRSFFIWVYFILVLSISLRIYNFQNRVGPGGDSGRDAMIAQVALERHQLPLFASFSSAGPFVFGPLFYWLNMASYILDPFTFEAPWVITAMAGIIMVMTMVYIGYLVGGKRLAVILGLLAACSPQFISRSTFLSQHGAVGVAGTFLLLFFVLFYQTKKAIYAFLMGVFWAIAVSMHYQALNLGIFLIALPFIPKMSWRKKTFSVILMSIGFVLPTLPNLYWDSKQNFANINNLLDYLLIGQYRIYVPNSWKIYLFQVLPDYWSDVVGGAHSIAFLVIFISGFSFLYSAIKKKIKGEILFTGIMLGVLMFIIRYYRGERFEGYLIYMAPIIFLISAWGLLQAFDISVFYARKFPKKHKRFVLYAATFFSILIFALVLTSDLKNASQFIFAKIELPAQAKNSTIFLMKKYPGQKIALYDYLWKTSGDSYALSLYLRAYSASNPNGHPIGVIGAGNASINPKIIIGTFNGYYLVDLNSGNLSMVNSNWTPIDAENIYDDLITRWTSRQKLRTTFSLTKFIEAKFRKN